MADWNPELYLKYGKERTQPSIDLVSRIELKTVRSAIDVGCGPGNSTGVLREKWPDARIVGVDNSEEMIRKARTDYPGDEWVLADAATLNGNEKYDLVFSNAVLQWIPDHASLVPRLFRQVARGGALAVQIPANYDSPLHRSLLEVARSEKWKSFTGSLACPLVYLGPDFYYDILAPMAGRVDMWVTEYQHVMSSHLDLVEWYKGTGMRPFLERVPVNRWNEFAGDVMEECRESYSARIDGNVLYPFRRLFFIAYKTGIGADRANVKGELRNG